MVYKYVLCISNCKMTYDQIYCIFGTVVQWPWIPEINLLLLLSVIIKVTQYPWTMISLEWMSEILISLFLIHRRSLDTCTEWVRRTVHRSRRSGAWWCRRSGARTRPCICPTSCPTTSTSRWVLTTSPNHVDLSPNHQDLSPNHQDLSPNHQDLSPNHQDLSPNHQDLSPNHKDLSPSRGPQGDS